MNIRLFAFVFVGFWAGFFFVVVVEQRGV